MMLNRKYIFLVLVFFILSCNQNNSTTVSQNEIQDDSHDDDKLSVLTTYTQDEYLDDFDQFILMLKKNHPQLHEYISKNDFDNLVNEKRSLLNDNLKLGEFNWLCRSVISSIGCGHSVFPTLGMNYFLPDALLFPLKVTFINEKLYVLNPFHNEDLISSGDEIISINGTNVKNIKAAIFKHISSDANNESLKMEYINDGFMEYAAFHFNFPTEYEVKFMEDEKLKTVILSQLNNYTEDEIEDEKCNNNLCLEIDKDIAIVTIRSFYYYRDNFKEFKAFVDSCFNEIKIKKIEKLIIDLRDNGGGDPYCGSYLLQHIADKPYQYYKTGTHFYEDLQESISPHENKFLGKPIILINGRCFSTTGQLCALIKANNFGIFVGKETGATYRCNSTTRPFELAHTGMAAFIATRTFEAAVSTLPKDRGIIPDYEANIDILDLLSNKDLDLELSINLLRREKFRVKSKE